MAKYGIRCRALDRWAFGATVSMYIAIPPCKVCGDTWNNPDVSHGFRNFEIAAGVCEGEHWGTSPFMTVICIKWMEGVASVYAVTKDPELDKLMDHFIEHVVKAQRADGYIHTPVIMRKRIRGLTLIRTNSNRR